MRRLLVPVTLLLGGLADQARAQKATEMWIPIGQSPGVSGVTSVVGTIGSCDQASGALQVAADGGSHTASIDGKTVIWLDRSSAKRPNTAGTRADCQQGRRVEVKFIYDGKTRTPRAEWIKIAAE
jgi:hypothetical protein